jgi:hypothetical protein
LKLRTLLVHGSPAHLPEGWEIKHTVLIEPKRGKPYFAVLAQHEPPQEQGAWGFGK